MRKKESLECYIYCRRLRSCLQRIRLQRTPTCSKWFILHLFTCCKQDPVYLKIETRKLKWPSRNGLPDSCQWLIKGSNFFHFHARLAIFFLQIMNFNTPPCIWVVGAPCKRNPDPPLRMTPLCSVVQSQISGGST